jgi:phosphoserine phosphatase
MVDIIESYENLSGYEKVATLDMGGTLVEDPNNASSHKRINIALGIPETREYEIYEEHSGENGDLIDHVEHARAQTEELRGRQKANISNYGETVQEIISDREIVDGAYSFVQDLQDQGYETMVVSSAPKAVTRPFAEDLEVDFLYRWKDFVFTDEEYFDKVEVNKEARYGKQDVVEGLQNLGVEVAHFGNGSNDIEAVKTADAGKKQWWLANPQKAFDYAFKEAKKL